MNILSYESIYRLVQSIHAFKVVSNKNLIKSSLEMLLQEGLLKPDPVNDEAFILDKNFTAQYLGYLISFLIFTNTHWRKEKYSKVMTEFTLKALNKLNTDPSIYDDEVRYSVERLFEIMDVLTALKTVRAAIRGGSSVSIEKNMNSYSDRACLTRKFLSGMFENFHSRKFETYKPLKHSDLKRYYSMEFEHDLGYDSFWIKHYSLNACFVRDSILKEIFFI